MTSATRSFQGGHVTGGSGGYRAWALLAISLGLVFLWSFLNKQFALGFATGRTEDGRIDVLGPDAWINGGSPTSGFLLHGTDGPLASTFRDKVGTPRGSVPRPSADAPSPSRTAGSVGSGRAEPSIGMCASYGRQVIRTRRKSRPALLDGCRTVALALWLAAALLVVSSASATAAEPPAAEVTTLSEPGVLSHWAFVDRRVAARARPDADARVVARLKLKTEDGTDELVMALASTYDADGREWVQVRLPIRPLGSTGWVPVDALEPLEAVDTWLRVDVRRLRATLIKSGRVVFRARIGVGRSKWPTPRGDFYIRNKFVGFPRDTIYGALAFGTSAKSEVLTDWPRGGIVGIHGTNRPGLIPGRVSHGCIRMRNRDILRLGRLMPVGTPLSIR